MRTPLALYQGPAPIRSRAFTAGWPLAACVLKYACQVLLPLAAPAATASAWQCASAPASPPRLAPSPLPALVTKKLIGIGGACGGGACAIKRQVPPNTKSVPTAITVEILVIVSPRSNLNGFT